MKLRNKKDGTIYSIEDIDLGNNVDGIWLGMTCYKSLAELNEEWEDYEEPKELKEYWCITGRGNLHYLQDMMDENDKDHREIGNCFETKEEAEKAVEKLKAWKRLKDGGITFKNWTINQTGTIDCFATWGDNIPPSRKNPTLLEDLDLLFGGENES